MIMEGQGMSINRVIISGNLTRDAVLRETSQNGVAVLNFCVAVNDRRKNQQTGEWTDHANFIDCSLFGTRATALSKFLVKGQKVAIEGKLRYSTWADKQSGETRHALGVTVDELELMGRRENRGDDGAAPQQAPAYSEPTDDDVPF